MNVTIYPNTSSPAAGINFDEASVVRNISGATVAYSDTGDPFVAEGTLTVGSTVTLHGSYFFRAAETTLLSHVPVLAGTTDERVSELTLQVTNAIPSILNHGVDNLGLVDQAAAIAALAPGMYSLPGDGIIRVATEAVVPAGVSFVGTGIDTSIFRLTTSGAKLTFADGDHGLSIGFSVQGGADTNNRVALDGIVVGLSDKIAFSNVRVQWTTTAAWTIAETQNGTFTNCAAYHNTGDGFRLDKGTGGHTFINCGGSNNRGYALKFIQSEATPSLYPVPSYNTFIGGIFERPIDLTVHASGLVYHGAGAHNVFIGTAFAGNEITAAMSLIVTALGAGASSSSVAFENCTFSGIASTTHIHMTGLSVVTLNGRCVFLTGLNALRFADSASGGYVEVNGQTILDGVTNWAVKTAGATAVLDIIKHRTTNVQHEATVTAAADAVLSAKVAAEAYPRIVISPDAILLGSGLAAGDTAITRTGVGDIGVTGDIAAGAALIGVSAQLSSHIVFGAAIAAAAAPLYSIFIDDSDLLLKQKKFDGTVVAL